MIHDEETVKAIRESSSRQFYIDDAVREIDKYKYRMETARKNYSEYLAYLRKICDHSKKTHRPRQVAEDDAYDVCDICHQIFY